MLILQAAFCFIYAPSKHQQQVHLVTFSIYLGAFHADRVKHVRTDIGADIGANVRRYVMTFEDTVNGYMEQRDKFIGEHSKVFNTLYQLNLDVLGLIPDDERKDLLEGIKDYTYLTMCDGMDLFADMLLGMICDKYPVIGLKIKKNKEKYVDKKYVGDLIGSDVSDNPGAKKVKLRSRGAFHADRVSHARPKQEPTSAPTSSLE